MKVVPGDQQMYEVPASTLRELRELRAEVERLTRELDARSSIDRAYGFKQKLEAAERVLAEARPYVHGVARNPNLSAWRIETAEEILTRIDDVLERSK